MKTPFTNQLLALIKKQLIEFRFTPFALIMAILASSLGALLLNSTRTVQPIDKQNHMFGGLHGSKVNVFYSPKNEITQSIVIELQNVELFEFTSPEESFQYYLDNAMAKWKFERVVFINFNTNSNGTFFQVTTRNDDEKWLANHFQIQVYNAISKLSVGSHLFNNLEIKAFPNTNTNTSFGEKVKIAIALGISSIISFSMVITIVTTEKNQKTFGLLRRFGMSMMAYWTHLALIMLVVSLLCGVCTSSTVKLISLLENVDFIVILLVITVFNWTASCFAMVFAGIISKPGLTNILNTAAVAISVILPIFSYVEIPYSGPFYISNIASPILRLVQAFVIPWFEYIKIMGDILELSIPGVRRNVVTGFKMESMFSSVFDTLDMENVPVEIKRKFEAVPSMFNSLVMLVIYSLVYILLSWYLSQVFTSVDGFKRPLLFPITDYISKKKVKQINPNNDLAQAQLLSSKVRGINAIKLSKHYKTTTAVREFSQLLECGKIYAILGENGAGKTSLISMLSGLTTPSFGNCFVNGFDIYNDINEIQAISGVCPQDDIFYPTLSAYQHFDLYVKFRGVEIQGYKNVAEYARDKLKAVGLEKHLHSVIADFSGGMKRRLSLALSTVGEFPILFLDEPTTGLDPISRRMSWDLIKSLKSNSVVVLTSHSMEEVEALGDMVTIMVKGRIKAKGTPLFLKNHYGKGYQISLLSKPNLSIKYQQDDLTQWILQSLPTSDIVTAEGASVTVGLQKEALKYLTPFLKVVQSDDIFAWSVCNSTLEEVFLRLSSENNVISEDNEKNSKIHKVCALCLKKPVEIVSLFTKTGVKVTVDNVICSHCALVEKEHFDNVSNEQLESFQNFKSHFINANSDKRQIDRNIVTRSSFNNQAISVFKRNFALFIKDRKSLYLNMMFSIYILYMTKFFKQSAINIDGCNSRVTFMDLTTRSNPSCIAKDLFKNNCALNGENSCFSLDFPVWGNQSISLNQTDKFWISGPTELTGKINSSNLLLVDDIAKEYKTKQDELNEKKTSIPQNCKSIDGATTGIFGSPNEIAKLYVDSFPQYGVALSNELTMINSEMYFGRRSDIGLFYNTEDGNCQKIVQESIDNGPGQTHDYPGQILSSLFATFKDSKISTVRSGINLFQLNIDGTPTKELTGIYQMMAVFLIFIQFIWAGRYSSLIVQERSLHLYEFQRIQGISSIAYWSGNFLFFVISSMTMSLILFVIGIGLDINGFNSVYMLINLLAMCFGFAGSVILITSISKTDIAFSRFTIVYFAAAFVIANHFDIPTTMSAAKLILALIPPIGMVITTYSDLSENYLQFWAGMLLMLIGSWISMLIGIFCHEIRPSKHMATKNPFSSWVSNRRKGRDFHKYASGIVDDDVAHESRLVKLAVQENRKGKNDVLLISSVFKSFGERTIVQGVDLLIKRGETFGLLGPNGAGKTTFLSMITGSLSADGGNIFIKGQLLSKESLKTVAICPQFDTVWPTLTVEEHLIFYSAMKGVPSSETKNWAREIAKKVELDGDAYYHQSSTLSGGMRRRLAIGIALTGNPDLLVLDEPTTGLDPATRRQIWNTITDLKKSADCTIIVTTHSMEEADALCNRIGVLVDGKFEALGSQLHLKNKFGAGMKLKFSIPLNSTSTFENQVQNKVDQFLNEVKKALCPVAQLGLVEVSNSAVQQNSTVFVELLVPAGFESETLNLFSNIEEFCENQNIVEWELVQSSLEDAFVNVVKHSLEQ